MSKGGSNDGKRKGLTKGKGSTKAKDTYHGRHIRYSRRSSKGIVGASLDDLMARTRCYERGQLGHMSRS